MPGVVEYAVYLEVGPTRTFAGALDWPGWCRGGRTPEAALDALVAYAPRYARVLGGTDLRFVAPTSADALRVAERLPGGSASSFGVPEVPPSVDERPLTEAELPRLTAILRACWRTFDAAVAAARGEALRKGPRGGGRELDQIVAHVLDGDGAYLWRLTGSRRPDAAGLEATERLERTRADMLAALEAASTGHVAPAGPRGGKRWTPRNFVRREAWHVLDHAWEIEDRRPVTAA